MFEHMKDNDIQRLVDVMDYWRVVPIDITKKVLSEFYDIISESKDYILSDRSDSSDNLSHALGDERAKSILKHRKYMESSKNFR